MSWTVMPSFDDYETAHAEFSWDVPPDYNPAVDCLRKHDDPSRTALRYESPDGDLETVSFRDLDNRSDRLAAALADLGLEAGDRVGVVVPQKPQNPIAHLANWKLGAVSVPLTILFGRDALAYRLADSEATAVVVDPSVRETVDAIRSECPTLEHVIQIGDESSVTGVGETVDGTRTHALEALCADHEPGFEVVASTPDTPSAIMYTSGSTGPPKGVLHSHALWLGRAAAAYTYFDQGLEPAATVWTPADWAWGAALGGTLLAAWHHGATVVGWPRDGFDPEAVFDLLERHDVTHSFMPPTALRRLMTVENPAQQYDLSLETLAAAGEPLTPEVVAWVDAAFDDVAINEFYGQTELNLVVGTSSEWFDLRPGSMGKPLPGYEVRVLDPDTHEPLEPGVVGELAVEPADRRVFFDEYWNRPEKTAAKQTDGGWFLTGDLVERDADGFLWFVSRADDVIITSGYRVGPMEVEEVLLTHDAVAQVGVVGVPDDTRGEAIKAFVQLASTGVGTDQVRAELRALARERLAEYEYPHQIEFVDELPTTTTGKIRRASLRDRHS